MAVEQVMSDKVSQRSISLIDFPFTVGLVLGKLAEVTKAGHMSGRFHFYVVGGVVRDTYRGCANSKTDIDIAFSGEYALLLRLIREEGSCTILKENSNLHTARIVFDHTESSTHVEFDLAQLRAEDYAPGVIYPAVTFDNIPIQWDLARRDFTINSIAYDAKSHEIIDPFHGYEDIQKGLIRVLHDMSFQDDPSRKERARDFMDRFGYTLEQETARLMEE